jgi:hypothetical protein
LAGIAIFLELTGHVPWEVPLGIVQVMFVALLQRHDLKLLEMELLLPLYHHCN